MCSLHIDDKLNDLGPQEKKLKAECKELAVAGEWRFEFKNKTAFSASCSASPSSSIIPRTQYL